MAVNRASNSRFMGWDSCAARPEIRRRSDISNFTATLPIPPVPVSRFHRAISAIIEPIWNGSYEIWKAASAFRDAVDGKGSGCLVSRREFADFLVCVYLK